MLPAMDVLNTKEAAELLRVTPRTVKQLAGSGKIPARKVGQGWRFSRAALLKHLEGEAVETVTTTVRRG